MNIKYKLLIFSILLGFVYACNESSELSDKDKEKWMQQGKQAVEAASKRVKDTLIHTMQQGGPIAAIATCSHLMQEENPYGNQYEIRRTALKYRNPGNKPTQREKQVLEMMRDAHGRKHEIGPVLDLHENGDLYYYHPIMVQPMCLNCHGKPGYEISESVFNAIKKSYPKDKAMGFSNGDFRGMWTVKLKSTL